MRLETHLRLANSYFSVEIPQAMANVQVQLVAPAGPSAAQGTLDGNQPELVLEVPRASEGNWQLVLLSYGGSDAKSNGDRVDYDVRAEYAPEAKA